MNVGKFNSLVMCVVFGTLAGCGSAPEPYVPVVEPRPVTSLDFPKAWTLTHPLPHESFVLGVSPVAPAALGFASVSLRVDNAGKDDSLETVAERTCRAYEKLNRGIEAPQRTPIMMGAFHALKVTYALHDARAGTDLRITYYFLLERGFVYTIIVGTQSDDALKYEPEIAAMLDAFTHKLAE